MNPPPVPIPTYSRRDFVGLLAKAGAAVPIAGLAAQAHAAQPAATTSAPASAAPTCLHVFSKPLQWMSYDETAALLAEAGYGGIDIGVRPGGYVLPEKVETDLPRAVEAARKHGLKMEMIVTAITDPREKYAETILKTAAQLGVKCYRLGYVSYDDKAGVWASLQKHKATFQALAELNARCGIHGAYQNHAGVRVGGPVWDLHELVRDADPRWLGVQYDVRHATAEGGESWPVGFRLLQPWIRCTDIKDFHWVQSAGKGVIEDVPMGEGIVNFDLYFQLVRELKVTGPISVHFEYPPFERLKEPLPPAKKREVFLAAMKKDLAVLKARMAKQQVV
ncbi:MAG: sugar phosphate isomerase/epimerase [Opitutus sp.]|nr:sugar phosphate isomerase/epimerase [Opitutus sp.]